MQDDGPAGGKDDATGQTNVQDLEFDAVDVAVLNKIKYTRTNGTLFQGQDAATCRQVDPG